MKVFFSISAASCCVLAGAPALAGPVGLTTGFERVESISHVRLSTTLAGAEANASSWRAGLGTSPGNGYSIPRVSLEYAWESGLSVGTAIGFIFSWRDRIGTDADVLEPRVGYAFALGDTLLLWPRLGLTIHNLSNPEAHHTALSLDVPFMFQGERLGSITVGPFVDIGLDGSAGDAEQTLSEFGLAVGFQFF